jgi:hypothetical protein
LVTMFQVSREQMPGESYLHHTTLLQSLSRGGTRNPQPATRNPQPTD